MNNFISYHLVKAIADFAIFLKFTSEESLNADASMEAMEQLAGELQRMDDELRINLACQLRKMSTEYGELRKARFIENLPESLGLL